MRRKLLPLLTILALGVSAAAQQIPNPGFNSWSGGKPTSWVTANDITFMGNPQSAFMETAAPHLAEGTTTLRLTSVKLSTNPFAQYGIPDTIGIAFTGAVNFLGPSLITGYPFTARPEGLTFVQKYTPAAGDTAYATVLLQRWNPTTMSRDTIAAGYWQSFTTTTDFSIEMVPLFYDVAHANTFPDTAIILFTSTSLFSPKEGSSLYVDALGWTGWIGIDAMGIPGETVTVYPNPASDRVQFNIPAENAASLEIFDVSGRITAKKEVNGREADLETSAYSPGIYFYNLLDETGNVLRRGNFSIMH